MVQKKKVILHNQNRKPDNILRKELRSENNAKTERSFPFYERFRVSSCECAADDKLAYLRDTLFLQLFD